MSTTDRTDNPGGGPADVESGRHDVIVAGLFGFLIAPVFASLVRFFPPVVTGCIITIIGISLFPAAEH